LPKGPLYSVEVRNRELLAPPYGEALAATGACHCFNVLNRMPDLPAQARVVPLAARPATIVRWLVAPDMTYEESGERYAPFDRLRKADSETRSAVAALARESAASGRDFLCTINNNAEGCAPASIVELAREILAGGA
jgi:hypothetical protein